MLQRAASGVKRWAQSLAYGFGLMWQDMRHGEAGYMNSSLIEVVGGIVAIAIAFVIFPIVLDATDTILNTANVTTYTGLESVVKVAPLIVFVGLLFGGGFSLFRGVKGLKG